MYISTEVLRPFFALTPRFTGNDFLILQDKVRSQDTVFVIGGVTGSVLGRDLGWNFVKDNWPELYKRYQGGFMLSRLTKVIVNIVRGIQG